MALTLGDRVKGSQLLRREQRPAKCRCVRARLSPRADAQFANQLEALKSMSLVVADTGEPDLVKKYKPVDCTTNPRYLTGRVNNAKP